MNSFLVQTEHVEYKRIFLLSDLHFGVRANSLEWVQNHKKYFDDFYIPYLKANVKKGDILFILGDWFDNRQLLDIYVMNTSIDVVIDLAEILPVKFITGNHDIYKKHDTDVNSIAAFKFIPNVTIYEKPVVISNGDSKILIMPWVGDAKIEENYIKENEHNYVFAHTTISGFKYDNSKPITNGVNVLDIPGISRLFSGHIHKRQEFNQLIYIGSPYHTKRSDINNQKGVYIFNPINNDVSFTPNNFSPIFQKVLLNTILDLTLEEVSNLFNNNYSDIIVADKHIHLFNLTKFVDILENCNYKKIETTGEQLVFSEELSDAVEGLIGIRDILELIELSIDDLGHQLEVLVKLKLINKKYYDTAAQQT